MMVPDWPHMQVQLRYDKETRGQNVMFYWTFHKVDVFPASFKIGNEVVSVKTFCKI